MRVSARVVVIYRGATDLTGCRVALAIAEGAWDCGAEVRVRRVEPLVVADLPPRSSAWADLVREDAEVPDLRARDLTWADAVLFGRGTAGDGADTARDGLPSGAEGSDDGPLAAPPAAPSAARLAAARDEGRRAVELVRRVKGCAASVADAA